jgi:hypothetical protein
MSSFLLSAQQRALWLLMQLIPEPQQCALNLCCQTDLQGTLDERAFADAVQRLADRHDALRLRLWPDDDELRQEPGGARPALRVCDLRARPDPCASTADAVSREATRVMDAENGPLAWFVLLRLADDRWRLVVTVHHLIADGWSMHLLLDDLACCYTSAVRGETTPDTAATDTYARFVLAQQARERDGGLTAMGAWWEAQLAGELPMLDLGPEAKYPAFRSFRGDYVIQPFDDSTITACRRASFRAGVPLSVWFLAAWARQLARRTGQRRMILGTHFAGRQGGRWHQTVGMFTNTVPLVLQIDPDATDAATLLHVHDRFAAAYEHQEYPLQRLFETCRIARNLSRPALFQAVFAHQAWQPSGPARVWHGLTETASAHVPTRTSAFELQLHVVSSARGTVARFDYSTDVLTHDTVQAMATEYRDQLAGPR